MVLWTPRRDTSTLLKTLRFSQEVLPKVNPDQKSGVGKIKRVEKDTAKRKTNTKTETRESMAQRGKSK